ncbi:MAG: stage V sporulation protein AE [Desulfitibacter sp. BRH_c19]|nr:MAG: stage V sporulation protein AE [Desulfitibacter sp. BRH_c19]
MKKNKRKVILITDGDKVARKAIENVAKQVGGRCISLSAGNPTPVTGQDLVKLIMETPFDPILVMLDDKGEVGQGSGERAMDYIINDPNMEVLGVVAVASNTQLTKKVDVDISIDRYGHVLEGSVNKDGYPTAGGLSGDTVEILEEEDVPIVVGTGDTGKMKGFDSSRNGNQVTLKAVEEILARSGFHVRKG